MKHATAKRLQACLKDTSINKNQKAEDKMKYICNVCGWIYDEDETGVKWEDLPEDFACELCGVGKDDFSEAE